MKRAALGVAALIVMILFFAGYFAEGLGVGEEARKALTGLSGVSRMLLAVFGLLMLENLFRNTAEEGRWAVKFLCFGLGTVFVYDFYLYADSVLFYRVDRALVEARGFVNALAVPLLAIAIARSRSWQIDIHLSRNFALHSAALLGSGVYLLLMSATGFYLKNFGGEWGSTIQIIFLFGAAVILLGTSSSETSRIPPRRRSRLFRMLRVIP